MRSLNKGWIGIALVILFGASLFFFSGSSRYSNLFNSDNFVANISGTQVSTTQFSRALEINIGQFAQMIGENLTGDQIRSFQIHQLVLQNLINKAVFENEFDNLNFILDDTTVAKQTKKRFPNLYEDNNINDDELNNFLRQNRLKIEDLVNIINYETRAVVFDELLLKENYPSEFTKKINLLNNQLREIKLLKISLKDIKVPNFIEQNITKNNQELINYFEENANNYLSEEKRDISYLVLDKESFTHKFIPSKNEIDSYFNNNKKLFKIPEQRSFQQLNFKSVDEANNFQNEINGLSNEEILKYANEKNILVNEFKDVSKSQVLKELSNVIFSLNIGEISDIVNTAIANHIIILDNISEGRNQTLDEVSDNIIKTLTDVQLDNFYNNLKLKVNQNILNGYSIEDIATENNLSTNKFFNTTQNVNNKNDLELSIINSAFSQNKEFISDIFDYDQNTSFIIYVDNIYPSEVQSIDIAFDNIKLDFVKFKKTNHAKDIFELNKDNKFEKIKSKFDQNIENLSVQSNSTNLPNLLINKIFETDLNKITFFSNDEDVYFVEINKINIPEDIEIYEDINLVSELKNAFGNEIIKKKSISINDELINGLLSKYK